MSKELAHQDLIWVKRRLPKIVRELVKENGCFVGGGFIRDCITNTPPQDVDIFCASKDASQALAKKLQEGIPNSRLIETDNAITVLGDALPIQFIHRWVFDDAASLIASFDFTIACAAIWFDEDWKSIRDEDFYSDLAARRLVYRAPVRHEDAGGSLLRVLKFYSRGYRIPLDSMGAVLARLSVAVRWDEIHSYTPEMQEPQLAKVLTGLLKEVDPNAITAESMV